jgi:hypothetical protein
MEKTILADKVTLLKASIKTLGLSMQLDKTVIPVQR